MMFVVMSVQLKLTSCQKYDSNIPTVVKSILVDVTMYSLGFRYICLLLDDLKQELYGCLSLYIQFSSRVSLVLLWILVDFSWLQYS